LQKSRIQGDFCALWDTHTERKNAENKETLENKEHEQDLFHRAQK